MTDLIRREDAARIAEDYNLDILEYSTGNRSRIGSDPVAEAIRALPTVTVQAQIDAERERADKAEAALRVSVGGCDANEGWSHKPISIDGGKYFFCQDCGETLTKAVANRHSTAAAIRKGDEP